MGFSTVVVCLCLFAGSHALKLVTTKATCGTYTCPIGYNLVSSIGAVRGIS